MPRITVDFDKCQSFGMCCLEAEHLFVLDDAGLLTHSADIHDGERDAADRAADICPTQAITIE
jgi:ferredoxin